MSGVVLAFREGGSIAAGDWLGYGALAAVLLAAVLFAGAAQVPTRAAAVGFVALGALAAWAAISSYWAPSPALARDEGLLTAMYACVFVVPALTLRTAADRLVAAAAVTGVLALTAVGVAVRLRFGADPLDLFEFGRLFHPVTYPNGEAALLAVGIWPAVALAARRPSSVALRVAAVGAATALATASLAAQSKGSALGLLVSGVVFFAIVPLRLRALVPTGIVVAVTALAAVPLTEPFRADTDVQEAAAIRGAGTAVLVATAAALLAGLAYVLLDRRLALRERTVRLAGRVAVAVLAVAAVAGAAAFATRTDSPSAWLSDQWEEFKVQPESESGGTHLVSLGSNRYDFWRVSLAEYREHPVAGLGSRGFAAAYLEQRRSPEEPARAHSLPFEVMAELGTVGLLLLLLGVGAPLAAALARGRHALGAAGIAAAGVYWLAHASVDWLWTIPSVGLPFFLYLGIGAAAGRPVRGLSSESAFAWASACLVLAAAFAAPWLSWRLVQRAVGEPSIAFAADDLRWARKLDPLTFRPYIAEWQLTPDPQLRLVPLERAVDKEPRSFPLRFLMGSAYASVGRTDEARRHLREALRLNPRDEVTRATLDRLAG